MPLSCLLPCGTSFLLVLTAALHFHLLMVYAIRSDLSAPFSFFWETSLWFPFSSCSRQNKVSCPAVMPGLPAPYNRFSVSQIEYPPKKKEGAYVPLSSKYYYSTLALNSLSGCSSPDWKSYSHPDCLLATIVPVENYDKNWIPDSFSVSFRIVFLSLMFCISLHCAQVWAPYCLPCPILLNETFRS